MWLHKPFTVRGENYVDKMRDDLAHLLMSASGDSVGAALFARGLAPEVVAVLFLASSAPKFRWGFELNRVR